MSSRGGRNGPLGKFFEREERRFSRNFCHWLTQGRTLWLQFTRLAALADLPFLGSRCNLQVRFELSAALERLEKMVARAGPEGMCLAGPGSAEAGIGSLLDCIFDSRLAADRSEGAAEVLPFATMHCRAPELNRL